MSVERRRLRNHSLAYTVLAVLLLVSCAYWAQNTGTSLDYILHGEKLVRDPFAFENATSNVNDLEPEAQAAGLRNGDSLLAVAGLPFEGYSDFEGALRRAKLGDLLRVHVRTTTATGQTDKDLSIELRPFTYIGLTKTGSAAFSWIILPSILLPLFCIVLGFWVAAVRVDDYAAWLLLVLMLGLANSIHEGRTLYGLDGALQPFLIAFNYGFETLTPVPLVIFGIVFPERLPFDRRFPWVKWIVLSPLLIASVLDAVYRALLLHHLGMTRELRPALIPFLDIEDSYLRPAAVVFFCAILVYRTVTAESKDARRRLLLLDTGAAVGLLPSAFLEILGYPSGWPTIVVVATLLIFPVTMAYVIVVHRAMDVRVVIRQGLQYLLATRGVRVLQAAVSIGIIITAATMSASTGVVLRVALITAGFVLLMAIGASARRLHGWIDRKFFREAYEADTILNDLAIQVRTIIETGPLLETVAGRIAASLHIPQIAILLNEGGAFRPAYALGYATPPMASIAEQSQTLMQFRKQQHAVVAFDKPDSWIQRAADDERASLKQLRSELLLPLSLNDQILGIMSLGLKQSEEPFSKRDIRLLDSVAAQTGLALENGRLTEAIKAEVATREKNQRELEIAREVQERLFPQEYPPVPGLDYAGTCRPAQGVGGDYYDFILPSRTELGIAIGDVSGKGIPAALLMATLRAFLHAQKTGHPTDLTAMMTNLNRLVFESSAPSRYATFFYAEFDSDSHVLHYVNAGHNPPMVFRSGGGAREVLRLDKGGCVIGLLGSCSYIRGCVKLESGDLMVLYTDGISEAMNAADEEWGEERMMDVVWANRTAPAREIVDRLMTAADAFAAGTAQHDDMTVIVVRAS